MSHGPAKAASLLVATLVLERVLAGPETVYFFAQQSVANLTLTGAIPGNLIGGGVRIESLTEAQQSKGLSGFSFDSTSGVLDAAQSLVPLPWSPSNPAPPPENLTVANPLAPPGPGIVLGQYQTTPWGTMGSTSGLVAITDISKPDFARADVLGTGTAITVQPATLPGLFGVAGQPGLSFDSVSEASATRSTGFTYGSSVWAISGEFTLTSADKVSLSFDQFIRLVGFSDVDCEKALSEVLIQFEIQGNSVGGVSASVSSASPVNETVNLFSLAASLSTEDLLPAGTYTFSIVGYSYAELCTAPETTAGRPIQMGLLMLAGMNGIRRLHQRGAAVETTRTA